MVAALWVSLAGCGSVEAAPSLHSDLKADEEVVFFPAYGYRIGPGNAWEFRIHGWVYEPEKRPVMSTLVRKAFAAQGVKIEPQERAVFDSRAAQFLVDNERRKHVAIRLGQITYALPQSEPNGHFSGTLCLAEKELAALQQTGDSKGGRILFRAILRDGDARVFTGEIILVNEAGLTVISDIDDTIKQTGVGDRKALLRRTFLEPFEAVPGMAELYRGWAQKDAAQFWYVSASPWQLYRPLDEFVRSNSYPNGVFFLRNFRWKDRSCLELLQGPEKYKLGVIAPLMAQFPNRRFVLVGDSGESDPEIYGALARQFSRQIAGIYIRDVSRDSNQRERFRTAFRELPDELWKVFREPAKIAQTHENSPPIRRTADEPKAHR